MLVELAILLIVGFVGFEIYLNCKFRPVAWFTKRFSWAGLVISLLISLALAALFPAVGLVLIVASVFSTIAIQPWYSFRNACSQGTNKTKARIAHAKQTRVEFVTTYKPVAKAVASPFWITYKLAKMPVNHKAGRKLWA
jgi:membrane protein implicated in regulation of membrane protease activity